MTPIPLAWRAVAWGGATAFAASLAHFLYSYAFTFAETGEAAATTAALVTNTALFGLFALHHSVFARERVRAFVARTVPPPLERSLYVWVASLLFIGVCALWRPVGGVAWTIPPVAGYLAMAAGAWLTLRSAQAIDVWDLAGVRAFDAAGEDGAGQAEFKTTGPYGMVRHPIYLGWFLVVFGIPVMTGTRLAFAIVSCAYLLIGIPLEERTLRRTTAGRYDEYIRLVRWRLLPWVY